MSDFLILSLMVVKIASHPKSFTARSIAFCLVKLHERHCALLATVIVLNLAVGGQAK